MKKLFFILTLALVSFGLSAQDGLKGTWFAGGQLSYGKGNTDVNIGDQTFNVDTKSMMFLPIVGTFITPDVAIGAGIGYMNDEKGDLKDDYFVFKPLARKYWNITGPVYLFGQVAAPMLFGDNKAFGLEVSPGIDIVVTSWMTIETSFTIFGFSYAKPDGGDSSWSVGLNPMNSINDRKVGDLQVGVKFLF